MQTLTITRPDDFHLHLRDGKAMTSIVMDSVRRFGRAIIMPNLKPPIVTTKQALDYRNRILACLTEDCGFEPLMTLYLTEDTPAEEIIRARKSGHVYAVKYYPAGATTHSGGGVKNIKNIYPLLDTLVDQNLPLLVHGEVTEPEVDIFDREQVFIDRVLAPLLDRFPGLRVVFEHITTRQAVEFVKKGPENLAATITPQHLLLNRNALFNGGFQPHHFCLPILKAEEHRQAVLAAATSGHPRFFLGTDSAPHARRDKESFNSCAGIYSAHCAIELYAEAFAAAGCLDRLEAFSSHHGADFYGLPRNQGTIILEKRNWTVPATLTFGDKELVPFRAGKECQWKLKQ